MTSLPAIKVAGDILLLELWAWGIDCSTFDLPARPVSMEHQTTHPAVDVGRQITGKLAPRHMIDCQESVSV